MHNQWHRYPGKTLVSFLSLTLSLMIGCCDWWCLCYGLYWAHCSFLAQLIKNTTPRRTQMNKVLRDIRVCVFKVNLCRCMCLCVSETQTILEPLRDYWKSYKLRANLLWVLLFGAREVGLDLSGIMGKKLLRRMCVREKGGISFMPSVIKHFTSVLWQHSHSNCPALSKQHMPNSRKQCVACRVLVCALFS